MSFFSELKRRNVVRVAVAYAIAGWLLIEVSSVLLPAFEAPSWVLRVIVLLIGIGFVLSVALAWAYELTPEGVEKTESVPLAENSSKVTGRKLDFVIIGVLVVAAAFFLVERSIVDTSGPFAGAEIDPASVDPSSDDLSDMVEEQRPEVLPNSVAVLPLENLSPDPDNAYFAAGMHEAILNQLVKLRNLNVISRTSVLQYVENRPSIPEIAEELNVEAVLEGSVRFDGENVLVQAQLIDGATDRHLWSQDYERELVGVFAIQADIAKNITNALEAEFSSEEQETIESVLTDSPQAYSLYLRTLSLGGRAGNTPLAVQYLDEAIEFDPEFALAYAEKALRYAWNLQFSDDSALVAELEEQARSNALRALMLDANTAYAHLALALVEEGNRNWAEAERAFARALEISPGDTEVLNRYGRFTRNTGDYEEAIRLLQRLRDLDPNAVRNQLGIAYRYARQLDNAAAAFREALAINLSSGVARLHLGYVEIGRGNIAEGLRNLEIAEQLIELSPFRVGQLAIAYDQANKPDEVSRMESELQRLERDGSAVGAVGDVSWAMMYLALGDSDQAYERLEAALNNTTAESFVALTEIEKNPWILPVLEEEPRFVELRGRIRASD